MEVEFTPIGHVESPFLDRFGTPRQGSIVPSSLARVHLRADLQPEELLRGIDGFSHIWLISVMHHNTNKKVRPIIHPPRLAGGKVGVLATRSPHRPNPIGLTLARLEAICGHTLWVSGIDLLNGTPLLDLKPYLPEADKAIDARAGWTEEAPWNKLPVVFDEKFFITLESLWRSKPPPISPQRFISLVTECLENDPRPTVYKDDRKVDPHRPYWLRLYDFDVEFSYEERGVRVHFIRWGIEKSKIAATPMPAGPIQSAREIPN